MKTSLTDNQIKYVLDHFEQCYRIDAKTKNLLLRCQQKTNNNKNPKILMKVSKDPLIIKNIKWINDLPIIFPCSEKNECYSIVNDTLVFHHDILKSCFYLLSGYQEYQNNDLDKFGRFKYSNSIQYKLGIATKPIVNYYFDIIAEALNKFHFIETKVKKVPLFNNFGFFLTHDIDNVDFYNVNRFLYKIKEILGLVKSNYSLATNIKQIAKTGFEILKFRKKQNPIWNFAYLLSLEQRFKLQSAFFFLAKGKKHSDSNYNFTDTRIKNLFKYIHENGCEIGIHGGEKTYNSYHETIEKVKQLQSTTPIQKIGGRQHRLIYRVPETAKIHTRAGLIYDTTLGFAEHEGFRNSYCMPFKLYDFQNDCQIDIWELPLNVMDVTLFKYRKLKFDEAYNSIFDIIHEIAKFNGIFTLLWHNDFFDEEWLPGITSFYEHLLQKISQMNPECILGTDIVKKMEKL